MKDDEFQFGMTIHNGDEAQPATDRKLKPQVRSKPEPQPSSEQQLTLSTQNYTLDRARHPAVCIATVFFKAASFFTYFFLNYFMSNVLTFILCVVLGSLDFWVVKNVSGRLLVGLRWWTDYDDKGNELWKYESHGAEFLANAVDSSFFWTSQIAGTVVWGLFLLLNVLQLDLLWALLLGINFAFCASNLYGYYMCHGSHKKKVGKLKDQIKTMGLMQIASRFM